MHTPLGKALLLRSTSGGLRLNGGWTWARNLSLLTQIPGAAEDGIDVRGYQPRRVTRDELVNASRVISFIGDLGDIAPSAVTVEYWDDVPEVRVDFSAARDLIVARLQWLLDGVEGGKNKRERD